MNETAIKPLDMSLVKPAWIVLIVGWIIILVPIPFTAWIGWLIAGVGGAVDVAAGGRVLVMAGGAGHRLHPQGRAERAFAPSEGGDN